MHLPLVAHGVQLALQSLQTARLIIDKEEGFHCVTLRERMLRASAAEKGSPAARPERPVTGAGGR